MKNMKRDWKDWNGAQYLFLVLHNVLSFLLFMWWMWIDNSFTKTGWGLFIELYTKTLLTMMAGRVFAYLIILGISKLTKKNIPNIYQMNFRSKFNNISFVFLFATALMSLIYAYGIDIYIHKNLFIEFNLWTYLLVYLLLKVGTYLISWIFLKITV